MGGCQNQIGRYQRSAATAVLLGWAKGDTADCIPKRSVLRTAQTGLGIDRDPVRPKEANNKSKVD